MTRTDTAITHRRVLAVAVPIVLSNATQPILGAVDTGVIGQMGAAAPIGAVALGAIVVSSLYWVFGFLRMALSGLVAQARGAGDATETGALLMRGLIVGGGGGLIFLALQLPLASAALWLAPGSAAVEGQAADYIAIRFWGAPAAIATFAISGWLIAMERTRAVLVLQLWINGLNILLDLWFVLGLNMGVEGVALATIIAEWTGLVLGIALCRAAFGGRQWRDWPRIFDVARLRRMAAVSGDILIRSLLLNAMFLLFMFQAAAFGDVTLAANQVLAQFLHFTAYALDGFAFAAEALVGQAVGARRRSSLVRASRMASLWALGTSVAMGAVFALTGGAIIDLMTTAEDVRAAARLYLPWVVLAPILGAPAWMLDGIFIGATRTRAMRNAAIETLVIFVVVLWVASTGFGNHGLWAAMLLGYLARAGTLLRRYPALVRGVTAPPTHPTD